MYGILKRHKIVLSGYALIERATRLSQFLIALFASSAFYAFSKHDLYVLFCVSALFSVLSLTFSACLSLCVCSLST